MRFSGLGMPTSLSSSTPRCHASRLEHFSWAMMPSVTCVPTVSTGFM